MHRSHLLEVIDAYRAIWVWPGRLHASFDRKEEDAILADFKDFVEEEPDCFERTLARGHITGSALVVSPDLRQVLLTLHAKLGKWLQLGGHADGHHYPHEVARREAEEESGVTVIRFLGATSGSRGDPAEGAGAPMPFDFDRHLIPGRPKEAEHYHYDVRYLIVADPAEPLAITPESKDLRWFTLDEARAMTSERSMLRQFDKLDWLRKHGAAAPPPRPIARDPWGDDDD